MNKLTKEQQDAIKDRWKADTSPLDLVSSAAPRRVGNATFIYCPFHGDEAGGKPNMAVYEDGYHCFRCGWHGDTVAFVMALKGWSYTDFINYIAQFEIDPTPPNTPQRTIEPKERAALDGGLVARFRARMADHHYQYWQAQGIPRAVLDDFQIGHTGQRWAFPWHYRGVLMGYKLRRDDAIDPTLEPKYISLKGSHYDAPYNIDRVILGDPPDVLLIQEDEKSTWAAACYGLISISSPAGKWSPAWSEMIRHIPTIIIIANNDEPGQRAALERQRSIGRRARIVCFGTHKDMFDLHSAVWDIPGNQGMMLEWLGIV